VNPLSVFRMPPPGKITGRTSSITNAFVTSILPVRWPSSEDVVEALSVLGMTPETVVCAYCGDVKSEWDHLRPLVVGKQPTGYISELCNLVPSCGKCNQSKGNKSWLTWIDSTAKLSPRSRGVTDLEQRIGRLHAYEQWREPTRLDFAATVGEEAWSQYWDNYTKLHDLMRLSQAHDDAVRAAIGLRVHEGYAS